MNNTFDFKRFGQVVARDLRLYLRRFGITLAVWVSIPILLWISSLVFNFPFDPEFRIIFDLGFTFATVMSAPGMVYGKSNLSREGVGFAMLPATNTEKFLSMILFCSIVTPILCTLGCWAVDSFLTLLPGGFKDSIFSCIVKVEYLGYNILAWFLFFIMESSIFMFGNMIFKRRKAGKTFAWILLTVFVMTLLLQIQFVWNALDIVMEHIQDSVHTLFWSGMGFMLVVSTCFNLLTYRRIKNQKY